MSNEQDTFEGEMRLVAASLPKLEAMILVQQSFHGPDIKFSTIRSWDGGKFCVYATLTLPEPDETVPSSELPIMPPKQRRERRYR